MPEELDEAVRVELDEAVPVWLPVPVELDEPVPVALDKLLAVVLGETVLAAEVVAESTTPQNSTATRPAPPLADSSRAPTPTPAA